MPYERDKDGILCAPPIHGWFGLSYSSYFVMPRIALEAMPHDWQRRFIDLMSEVESRGLETPDYHVLRADKAYTTVKKYDEDDETSRGFEFTAWFPDPWANYRHGKIEELCPQLQGAPMTTTYLAADVANLEAHIHSLLGEYPELADDEQLRQDCLEGETDLHSVLSRLVNIERDADSMAKAIAERVRDLGARKARAEKRKDAMRVLMLRVMRAASVTKAQLPEATVSISKGRDSVDITDDKKLPSWAYEAVRKPDKKAIMERLAANKNVPGAALVTGGDTVTVRVG